MRLLRKLHTYAGLLTFVNLVVYGVAGLAASWLKNEPIRPSTVHYEQFTSPPNLTDRAVAELVCQKLQLSLATPVNSFAFGHDADNNLTLDLRHVNGGHKVTLLEKEGRMRVEVRRNSLAHFFFTLHETTAAFHSGDWRMQLWADYNEFAMWSLAAMIVSGVTMFVASRLGSRLAQVSLAAGCGAFAALYYWSR